MKKILTTLIVIILSFLTLFSLSKSPREENINFQNTQQPQKTMKYLEKYTIENLSKSNIQPGKFTLKQVLKEDQGFNSYLFEFEFNPTLDNKLFKKTTGQINIPKEKGSHPLLIMLRGYVDQKRFKTGDGTRNASAFFAKNGIITIAPDFLGYGGSDKEAENIFEARFQSYVTVLSLIKTFTLVQEGKQDLIQVSEEIEDTSKLNDLLNNFSKIFLWGHSNGGQIALTVLEITQGNYPTTLWAPVSVFFPYSILFYTDESEDRGKFIRKELAKFEELYDPDLYSLDLYLEKINSPLQIHQGLKDTEVPATWTENLVNKLRNLRKDITYYKYANADHNLQPDWNLVVERDLEFFKIKMSK